MAYYLSCAGVLLFFYLINISYMSVFYHRGLTHRALTFRPWMRRLVILTGPWVTGLDPKVWACLHRMHHIHSDSPEDPHSPVNVGVIGVMMAQKNGYCKVTEGLLHNKPEVTSIVEDLDFPVHWLSRHNCALLPYALHGIIALIFGIVTGLWLVSACYFVGMMSHPIQGWMVNSFGHAFGYRNYATKDNSRNNLFISFLVLGEGYQNNHHQSPESADFGSKWWELDMGFIVCRVARLLGMVEFADKKKIKAPRKVQWK